jgi:DNA-directed RNA polymerase specialized sigma24 family protein
VSTSLDSPPTGRDLGARIRDIYERDFARFARVATGVAGGDPEAGRDCVQEAFARALARGGEYRGDGPLEAWLWRIVINRGARSHVGGDSSRRRHRHNRGRQAILTSAA